MDTNFHKVAMVFNSMGEYEELYDSQMKKILQHQRPQRCNGFKSYKNLGQNHFNELDDEVARRD